MKKRVDGRKLVSTAVRVRQRVPLHREHLGGVLSRFRVPQMLDHDRTASWWMGTGEKGVLLVHGFAGSPWELRKVGAYLSSHGYRCYAPLLAGHGTSPEALAKTGRADWIKSVRDGVDLLAKECSSIMVVGQSMGGTLALHVAATDPRITAVTTMAAPLWLGGPWPIVLPFARYVIPWHSVAPKFEEGGDGVADCYRWRSNRAVVELFSLMKTVRGELSRISAPVLILHGGADTAINVRNSLDIARGLRHSRAISRIIFPKSGHGMAGGVDVMTINERIVEWFDRFGLGIA